ncbi:MAG: sugar ABC transporter substrate-binding protein [Erysipelothrix sp.]|nr:sugar ABC transporter substrate-binding protein [Erysipelothrix sp.]
MKKLFTILLVMMMALALVACSTTDTPNNGGNNDGEKKTIVVMTPNATHGFTGQSVSDAQTGTKALAEEHGLEYKIVTSPNATEQASQIEQIVAEKPDIVVLWPHDDTLKSAAQDLVDAGIPVLIYDRLLDDFEEISEVMGDNVKIGEDTGKYFNEFFADEVADDSIEKLYYVEFKGDNSSVPQQRSDGFQSTIDDKFEKLGEWSTGWQRAEGQRLMEEFMGTPDFAKLDAIFTHDAEVALGVLQALEGYDGDHKVKLVSAVSEPKQLLDKMQHYSDLGIEVVTFTFNPNMVVDAVEQAIKYLEGETIPELYLIPTQAVDITNYQDIEGWGQ